MLKVSLPAFLVTLLPVTLNLGMLVGSYFLSWLIGIYGRAKIYKLSIILTSGGGILCSIGGYYLFAGLSLVGLGIGGDISISYTVMMECLPTSHQHYLTLVNIGYCIGAAVSSVLALVIETQTFEGVEIDHFCCGAALESL
jgi:MFS family permease